jgi:hypothetical protein
MDATGLYLMDSLDMWTTYGVFVEKGHDQFLMLPERKESITYSWPDQDGIDIDTATPRFKEREVTLNCSIIANNEADFWSKYDALKVALTAPGTRNLYVNELGKDFDVIYMKCPSFTKYTRLKTVSKIAAKFQIVFIIPDTPQPLTDEFDEPLTDDDDNILYA